VLGGAAKAINDIVQAPVALCAQSVLGAAALAVQGHADVVISKHLRRPLSLSLLSIAKSGERKTTCDDMALKPVYEREKDLREAYAVKLPDYQIQYDAWRKARDQALNGKSNRIEKEADLKAVGAEPVAPLQPMLVCPEPTYEGLCKALSVGQPSMGIFSNEGAQFVGGHGMSQDNRLKTAAGLSKLWDGDPIKRVRAGDATVTLPGRRVCMHLMLQPQASMELLSDSSLIDQGLLSRILVTAPKTNMGGRFSREPSPASESAFDRYCLTLTRILETPPETKEDVENELTPPDLPLSAKAAESYRALNDHVEKLLGPNGALSAISGFAAKLGEHAARIAGILELVDDLEAPEISADAMDRGIDLAQYYAGEVLRLHEAGSTNLDLQNAQDLLNWLQGWTEPAISLPDIYRNGPVRIRDAKTARHLVNILIEHGWLVVLNKGATIKGAKRREAWQIVKTAP
jgi:hypothetical protein